MQAYSDPKREQEPHALPDLEVFYRTETACSNEQIYDGPDSWPGEGWYYWHCSPGCLPNSDPIGPFPTEAEALQDAQDSTSEYGFHPNDQE